MDRFELKQTIYGAWCIVDAVTQHPEHPSWKLAIAASTDRLELEDLRHKLNRCQPTLREYIRPEDLGEDLEVR